MSNWKEGIRELVEEAKTGTGKGSVLAIVVLVACLLGMLIDHYHTATVRFAYLIEVAVVLALTVILTLQYRHQLNDDKLAKKNVKAKMKFAAEIFAAFAVLSFFLSFYRLGLDLDRANPDGRIVHLTRITADLNGRVCAADAGLKEKCDALNAGIANVKKAIWNENEGAVRALIRQIRIDIVRAIGSDTPPWFDVELERALIDDDTKIFSIIVLYLTLLFSSMAISRKIAIAWSEKDG